MRTLKVIAIGLLEVAVVLPAYYVVAPLLFRATVFIPPDTWVSSVIVLVCAHVGVMLRTQRPARAAE